MTLNKTKIVCTIGPASASSDTIRQFIREGMTVARLNFSHGTHENHAAMIQKVRQIAAEENRAVAILQDLCGPKIRVGEIPEPGIWLKPGQDFTLTADPVVGNKTRVSVSYAALPSEVNAGDRILLADGLLELSVTGTGPADIRCQVVIGGWLTAHKGLNLPTGTIKAPVLTDKDRRDLAFGLEQDVDYIAISFVRSAEDVRQLKTLIEQAGKDTPVIAKIEKHEAIKQLPEIIELSDGIMVARGDLGVEIAPERVPLIQKSLIREANLAGKPVIIATQMLRSMVDAPRPTRAETSDVANGVLDGADAVMLSEETASGSYPVEAVRFMARIIGSVEKSYPHQKYLSFTPGGSVSESVARAACVLAEDLDARAIVVPTQSGFTAKNISRFRPQRSILAFSTNPHTVRRLCLYWGCTPALMTNVRQTGDMVEKAVKTSLDSKVTAPGDKIIITSGHPLWVPGTTQMIRVREL